MFNNRNNLRRALIVYLFILSVEINLFEKNRVSANIAITTAIASRGANISIKKSEQI